MTTPSPLRRLLAVLATGIAALALPGRAAAQLGVPVQGPRTELAGTSTLGATLGVVHEPDLVDFTDGALFVRGTYGFTDEIALGARLGGLFGDLDEVVVGASAKAAILRRETGFPVDLSGFLTLDLGGGETTLFTLLNGLLLGTRLEGVVERVALAPYAGVALGVTGDGDDTDVAFGFLLGSEADLAEDMTGVAELGFGVTDGLPLVSFHVGASWRWPARAPRQATGR